MLKRNILLGLVVVAAVAVALAIRSKTIGQAASTQPDVVVSPQAQSVLDQLRSGYGSLKTLAISGTVDGNFDVDGAVSTRHGQFNGLYNSTGLFRNEVKETDNQAAAPGDPPATQPAVTDTLLGNTGKNLFLYLPQRNGYVMMDLPEGKIDLDSMSSDFADVLRSQNLSLALAVSGDAAAELLQMATNIDRAADVKIDGQSLPTISISYPRYDITLSVDPQTHLLRRTTVDLSRNAKLMGATVVKNALLTTDFTNQPGAPAEAEAFDWSPPPGAQPLKAPDAGADLENKPAPAFSLTALDGSKVNSQDLKGSVYLLDFWATWCPTCIEELPKLDAIYKEYQTKGVKFYAVDQMEEKDQVQKYVSDSKLTIPVLMDTDGSFASRYAEGQEIGLPLTVIVGKDGSVIKVDQMIGKDDEIRAILDAALKK